MERPVPGNAAQVLNVAAAAADTREMERRSMTGYYAAAILVTAAAAWATSWFMPQLAHQQFDGGAEPFRVEIDIESEMEFGTFESDFVVDPDFPGVVEDEPGLSFVGVGGA